MINSAIDDGGTLISPDGRTLYFSRSLDVDINLDIWQAAIISQLAGDMNGDGVVNGLDVTPFVEVLLSGSYQPQADMNEDQVINGLDVDPFVAVVVDGVQQIPEPSTLVLAALGLLGFVRMSPHRTTERLA